MKLFRGRRRRIAAGAAAVLVLAAALGAWQVVGSSGNGCADQFQHDDPPAVPDPPVNRAYRNDWIVASDAVDGLQSRVAGVKETAEYRGIMEHRQHARGDRYNWDLLAFRDTDRPDTVSGVWVEGPVLTSGYDRGTDTAFAVTLDLADVDDLREDDPVLHVAGFRFGGSAPRWCTTLAVPDAGSIDRGEEVRAYTDGQGRLVITAPHGDYGGRVFRLDAGTGRVRWERVVGNRPGAAHLADEAVVLSTGGPLYTINAVIQAADIDNRIIALSDRDGRPVWQATADAHTVLLGGGDHEDVLAAEVTDASGDNNYQTRLRSYRLEDGEVAWDAPLQSSVNIKFGDPLPVALVGDVVLSRSSSADLDGHVIEGHAAADGARLWTSDALHDEPAFYDMDDSQLAVVTASDGMVVGVHGHEVYRLDLATGELSLRRFPMSLREARLVGGRAGRLVLRLGGLLYGVQPADEFLAPDADCVQSGLGWPERCEQD